MTRHWLFPTPVKRIAPKSEARLVFVSPRAIVVDTLRLTWGPMRKPAPTLHLVTWGIGLRELSKRDFVLFVEGVQSVVVDAHSSLWFAFENKGETPVDLQAIGLGRLVEEEAADAN